MYQILKKTSINLFRWTERQNKLLKMLPRNPRYWSISGKLQINSLSSNGNIGTKSSYSIYERALEKDRDDLVLIIEMGKALVMTHDYNRAIKYYEQILKQLFDFI